jgi:hypothetical protein
MLIICAVKQAVDYILAQPDGKGVTPRLIDVQLTVRSALSAIGGKGS